MKDFEILGQGFNYPRDKSGVVSFIATILGFVVIVLGSMFFLIKLPPQEAKFMHEIIGKLTGVTYYEAKFEENINSPKIEKIEQFRLEFWTPSKDSISMESFSKDYGNDPSYAWQVHDPKANDIERKNTDFGRMLKNSSNITGYRRYEVWGEGHRTLKTGWWWVIGVKGRYDKDFGKWFAESYKEFWGTPQDITIRMEVSSIPAE